METKSIPAREAEAVKQFSVFTANRTGQLNSVIKLLSGNGVHVLAITVLDTTDSAIIRLVTDDPDQTRALFTKNNYAFCESDLLVVEVVSTTQLGDVISTLLEGEVNIHYLYAFIPQPGSNSMLGLSTEDSEIAEQVLKKHQYRVLKQSDILR